MDRHVACGRSLQILSSQFQVQYVATDATEARFGSLAPSGRVQVLLRGMGTWEYLLPVLQHQKLHRSSLFRLTQDLRKTRMPLKSIAEVTA